MKKNPIIPLIFMLWASLAAAQEAPAVKGLDSGDVINEGEIGPVYTGVSLDRSPRAAEYEYLKSSAGANLHVELAPLPNRFSLEGHVVNQKDYYGDMNYAYRDVVLFNFLARGVYHNLDHYSFGTDNAATTSPSFIDMNPDDQYATENALRKGFVRFKTPDFPFHVYADATRVDRSGTMQQRFMHGYTGGLNLASQTRYIDWSSTEVHAGVNSHLGPIEIDYNHGEKKFGASADKVLYDPYALMTAPHNLTPDLTSSSDTVKLHSSLTGRIVASGTYGSGTKKNEDSAASARYRNSAGDLTLTPVTGLVLALKYRHYDLDLSNPDTAASTISSATYAVRDSLSSKRDVTAGIVRYRLTARLTVKGEYLLDTVLRDTISGLASDSWAVADRTTKFTAKFGFAYRMLNSLSLRADYSSMNVENPAYANDPDQSKSAKATLTWTPVRRVIVLASYGGVREKRDELSAPLAGGSRKTDRDQGLGSLTFLVGKRTSITASALYYQNKAKETLTTTDAAGMLLPEESVPYTDKARVYSLSATQALGDSVTLIAEASKSYSSGMFRTDSALAASGIDVFSDLRVVENTYAAGVELQHSKTVSSEFRYQQQHYDDKIDNTQDGKVNIVMATVAAKW